MMELALDLGLWLLAFLVVPLSVAFVLLVGMAAAIYAVDKSMWAGSGLWARVREYFRG